MPPQFGYIIPTDVVGAFADAILQDKVPLIPGEDGLEGIKVTEAMYQSAQERRWVKLSELK